MNENIPVPKKLQEFFENNNNPALAFSGGTDSSYLFYAAVACGADVTAYFVKTQFQPVSDMENAERTAKYLSKDLTVLLRNALSDENVRKNPNDRCYHCKKNVFKSIIEQARIDKKTVVIDGTNASDDLSDRPGSRALEEMGILSPLRQCGITKQEIRGLSKDAGLWNWNLPSNSCMATRIPYGIELTEEKLLRIEDTEEELRRLGLSDFRVRARGSSALLETIREQEKLVKDKRQAIEDIVLKHYDSIEYGTREGRP